MKLRNLFLAGLAAMIITSCSSENDPIENNENGEKNAIFNFSIALPNALAARAAETAGTAPGTPKEQKVNDITLVLTYEGEIPTFTKNYPVSAFTPKDNVYTLTNAERVVAGTATLTVYVNNQGVPAETTIATTDATGLGNYASTENEGNFFMSGKSANSFTIEANTTNTAPTVEVDRIAVKLDECTDTDANTNGKQATFSVSAENSSIHKALTITLTDYAFSNLNKKSNALAATDKYYKVNDFFNPFVEDQEVTKEDSWEATFSDARNTIDKTVTYCFENGITTPTKIYYKAKVVIEGVTEGTTFYVDAKDNTLYKNFAELNTAYNNALESAHHLTANSSNTEFMQKIGVKKYTNGICYYSATIHESGINRNNWYKLKVINIEDLGLPEIDIPTPGEPTYLIFSVTVNPWNVWNNDITLQ